jgi:RNA polymerase sigma factor (sigma-70 family)
MWLGRGQMNRRAEKDLLSDLMRSAQDGDANAYGRLLREITPLLGVAIRRSRPYLQAQDVDDLLQTILLAIHAVRATYDPARPFLPWLTAIARNQIAEGGRKYFRQAGREEALPETFSDTEANIEANADSFGDPQALQQAIAALPAAQQRAIELLKLKEMSLKEAAVATGMSIAALKTATHRAMRALRKALMSEA